MTNKNKRISIFAVFFILVLFFYVQKLQAQSSSGSAVGTINSPDVIAVRIISNPHHYNIARWYANQGFQGSPQSLIVDGYEAIRDGRTVYVNAANIDSNKNIYTNVYLISYNQDSSNSTIDILGQIISHWKFNNNLTSSSLANSSVCNISTISCSSNADCASNQYCASSGQASSTCLFQKPVNCETDYDCPTSFFCNSLKSKITRDVKRIGQLEELKKALINFKTVNNHYPLLSSGTYLAGNTVSLWPSWSQDLLSSLAVSPSLIDPVNHLGACPGYSQPTCWNQNIKKFFSNPGNSTLTLPKGSYALAYSTNSTGSNYHLCATLESKALGYHFYNNDPTDSNCITAVGVQASGSISNSPPKLLNEFLKGEAYQEFNGFIKVVDPNGDPLDWKLSPAPGSVWTTWSSKMAPVLKDTSNPEQKKVYAKSAGQAGVYKMLLTVKDGQGGVLSTITPITINLPSLTIIAQNSVYNLNSQAPFNYSFSFSGQGLSSTPIYSVQKISGPFDLLNKLSKKIVLVGDHKYQVTYSANNAEQISAINSARGASFSYEIKVTDNNNHSVTKDFKLEISLSALQLNLNCPSTVRLGHDYNCDLGSPNLSYTASGLPLGLTVINNKISGSSGVAGSFPVTVKAKNNYGAEGSANFILTVNTYCGDGLKQSPNFEGRGGLHNDGDELCDGNSGVTASTTLSSPLLQYACRTGVGADTPNPILTDDQCIFKSPTAGGGYCGDGYCQARGANNQVLETCGNCPQDCGACVLPRVIIKGTVTSYAYYGYPSVPLANVQVVATDNSNSVLATTTTDSQGKYFLSLNQQPASSPSDKAVASLYGYDPTVQNFVPSSDQIVNFMMSTASFRALNKIKLTWGQSPSDLDSHLTFSNNSGSYNIRWNSPSAPFASLDFDVTTQFGPENISIKKYVANNYKYYVYNYTNCRGGSTPYDVPFGTAKVTIYDSNNGVVKVYNADPNQNTCYWHVFNLNQDGDIQSVNIYTNSGPAPSSN